MEELDLNIEGYADAIAQFVAFFYWRCDVDTRCVNLASVAPRHPVPQSIANTKSAGLARMGPVLLAPDIFDGGFFTLSQLGEQTIWVMDLSNALASR